MRELFIYILNNYRIAKSEPFSNHPIKHVVTKSLPLEINKILRETNYHAKGSVGQFNNWATIPWVAILEKGISTTQSGVFPAYLFCEDLYGFYLSIVVGFEDIAAKSKLSTIKAIRLEANRYLLRMKTKPGKGFDSHEMNLGDRLIPTHSTFPEKYNAARTIKKFYHKDRVPTDESLIDDLMTAIGYYELMKDS